MPRITPEKCHQGGHSARPRGRTVSLPWDDKPAVPMPDQSRYGPRGTTDSPRYGADGRRLRPRETKGDTK